LVNKEQYACFLAQPTKGPKMNNGLSEIVGVPSDGEEVT
jgi:hypothetical protein